MHMTEMKNIEQLANEELEKISGGLHGHGFPGLPAKRSRCPRTRPCVNPRMAELQGAGKS